MARLVVLFIAALFLSGCGGGGGSGGGGSPVVPNIPTDSSRDTIPIPKQYDPALNPFLGSMEEGDAAFIASKCGTSAAWGCTNGKTGSSCVVYLPRLGTVLPVGTVTQESIDNLKRHEAAHCLGWPAWHPSDTGEATPVPPGIQ